MAHGLFLLSSTPADCLLNPTNCYHFIEIILHYKYIGYFHKTIPLYPPSYPGQNEPNHSIAPLYPKLPYLAMLFINKEVEVQLTLVMLLEKHNLAHLPVDRMMNTMVVFLWRYLTYLSSGAG